ncbi:MAG: hypothetical protein ACK5JS_01835 [Mangrovibacterium sp.]
MNQKMQIALGFLFCCLFMVPQQLMAQDEEKQEDKVEVSEGTPEVEVKSLSWWFDEVLRGTTTLNEHGVAYRVIRQESYQALQNNVADTLQVYYAQREKYQAATDSLVSELRNATQEAEQSKLQLEEVTMIASSVKIFGSYISIASYKTISWVVVLVLAILLVVVFLMFKRGHAQVKEIKKNLEEVQDEYENHRKNALTREQKLARELMDVKIKNNLI